MTEVQYRQEKLSRRIARLEGIGLDGRLAEMTLETFVADVQPDAYNAVVELSGAFPGSGNLVLLGIRGTGKTHLAVGALHIVADGGFFGRYVYLPGLILALNSAYERASAERTMLEPLTKTPLLVLDDIGREKLTDYMESWIDRIIDARWVHQLPTILTANLTKSELLAWLGKAAASRIQGDCQWVTMEPVDRRLNPIRVDGATRQSPIEPCEACHDAGWVIDERRVIGTDRLVRCPKCKGRWVA